MPSARGAARASRSSDVEVLERQNDLVFALDADLVVAYVNHAVEPLLGLRADEVVGRSVVELVHADDLERAAEVVAALQSPDDLGVGVTPAIYRIRRADETWLPLEITGSAPLTEGPFRGWMVMIGRYSGDYDLHLRISGLLTSGADVDDVLGLVPEFGRWRHPGQPYVVWYSGADGRRCGVGHPVGVALALEHHDESSPWSRALDAAGPVQCGPADLPDELRRAAALHGLEACIALAVGDPARGGGAVIVAWSTIGGPPLAIHRYAIEQMRRALELVTQWREHVAGLEHAAHFDALTGLTNRAAFLARLGAGQDPVADGLVVVCYVDLDDFKRVNDDFGHHAGDALLVEVAARMAAAVREGDVVARLGGDEFAVLCEAVRDLSEAKAIAERIVEALRPGFEFDGHLLNVGASVGVASSPSGAVVTDELLERADTAMYEAKATGKNRWRLAAG